MRAEWEQDYDVDEETHHLELIEGAGENLRSRLCTLRWLEAGKAWYANFPHLPIGARPVQGSRHGLHKAQGECERLINRRVWDMTGLFPGR